VISCLVADDHPAVLQALARVLAEEGFAVSTAQRGDEALEKLAETRPDVGVIDAQMPGLSGLELARRAQRDGLPTALVLYSGATDQALLRDAAGSGVRGFVLKDAPLSDLIRAIHVVAGGGTYVDGTLAGIFAHESAAEPDPQLTTREREVLRELAAGRTYEEMGERLSISPATARVHVQKAMRRLGAKTRTQAVAAALRRSLIE
jgi:two-component system, NarL family, nitrate/nitrite response regulator NarL